MPSPLFILTVQCFVTFICKKQVISGARPARHGGGHVDYEHIGVRFVTLVDTRRFTKFVDNGF